MTDSDFPAQSVCLCFNFHAFPGIRGDGLFQQNVITAVQCLHHMAVMIPVHGGDDGGIGELTQLQQFKERGVENILALRGDVNPEIPRLHEFEYASDLTKFIKENGDFHVSGACYPECHLEAASLAEDIKHLKIKVEAGAEHLMSQLFFDNDTFHRFREMADIAGINVPIEAGIMPVVNKKQIERMVSMCGASLPPKFAKMMQRYEHNPEALRDAGIAYAIDQIVDLISSGVDGIHLYTMNNPYVARKISEAVRSLL